MSQSSDAVDWVGALFNSFGVVMVDAKDNIKINSDETRQAMEYMKKLMAVNPPEVYAWDDAGNNRWLIPGKASGIMNPPSPGRSPSATTRRRGELLDPSDADGAEGPFRRSIAAILWPVGVLEEQGRGEGSAALSLAEGIDRPAGQASYGYDLPSFKTCTTSTPGRSSSRGSAPS